MPYPSAIPDTRGSAIRSMRGALTPTLLGTCAVVCGVLSAQPLSMTGDAVLRVLALWLLADAVVGLTFRELMARRGRAAGLLMRLPGDPGGVTQRPDASADAPDWASLALEGWRGQPGVYASVGATQIWPAALALVLSALLGRDVVAVTAVGLVVASLLAISSGDDLRRTCERLSALHVTVAWWIGSLAFASLEPSTVGLGLLAGVGTLARLGRPAKDAAYALLRAAMWLVLIAVPLIRQQPIVAGLVSVAALVGASRRQVRGSVTQEATSPKSLALWLLVLVIAALAEGYAR